MNELDEMLSRLEPLLHTTRLALRDGDFVAMMAAARAEGLLARVTPAQAARVRQIFAAHFPAGGASA